jgi:hypothetical protein
MMKSVLKAGYEFDQLLVLGILGHDHSLSLSLSLSFSILHVCPKTKTNNSFKMWFLFAYFWVRNGAMLDEKKKEIIQFLALLWVRQEYSDKKKKKN